MGQTVFPAYSLVGSDKQWLAPSNNAPSVGCALLDYGPHPSIANTRLLGWSARPILLQPTVAAGAGTDYYAGDGTWKATASTTPAGSGTELQYRNGSSFGAVTGSSVSGSDVTVGGKITLQPAGSSFNNTIFRVNRPDASEAAKIHLYNDGGGTGGYVNFSIGSTAIQGNLHLGRGGGLTLGDQTTNRWMFYTANSPYLYFYDYTNARIQFQLVPGTAAASQTHINSQLYTIGDLVSFRGLDSVARCSIHPEIGRMILTSGTSYTQIDAGAAGANTHASLALVTSLGAVNLFNWHANGKTYLDTTGDFELRTAGTTRLFINGTGSTMIGGASNSGMPVTIKGATSFEHSASTAQNIVLNPNASQLQLLSTTGVTTLFNYSGDGRTYLDSSGFVLRSNGVEAVTGFGSGRVFIGAPGSDPGARFTVGGNSSFQGNVDVTGTLSAAVFEPNYVRIPGASAVTGTYVLATIGDNAIGFSGANDADSKHLIEHKACSYMVNGGSIVNYTGVRYGMAKEGSWNIGDGGTQVGAAFIVETSSGGSVSTLPTLTERLRVSSDGKVTFTVTGNATRSIGALFKNTSDIVGAGNDYENEVHVVLQAGSTANHRRYIDWKNYNGTDAYLMGVNAGGAFIWYDSLLGHRVHMHPDGYTQINSFGAYAVEINNYPGSDTLGTGGVAIYSGGSLVGRKKIMTVGESASSDVRLDGRFFWGGSLNNEVGRMTYSGIDAYIDAFQDGGALYLRSNVGGSITQAAKITAGEVYVNAPIRAINNVEIYGTAGANKLAVWNNISKDYLRFAIDSNTGEATFSGGSGSMYIRPYGGSVQLTASGYLNVCTTYTDMAFVTNFGGSATYPLLFQNSDSVFGGHITSKFQTLSVDPTTSDIPSGSERMVHNSTSGTTKLWANVGGTMKSVALT